MQRMNETLPQPLPAEPMSLVERWLAEATGKALQPNPNAMVVATTDAQGRPSARVVLCKQVVPVPGFLVFFTNYLSRKGRELKAHPRAAAVLHWDHLHRQVRIEGPVLRTSGADSDAYFASRHWQSRLGAWASAQSEPIASREALLGKVEAAARRFAIPNGSDAARDGAPDSAQRFDPAIPRPPHWGGFQLWAESVELWVEGDARVHDRARWTRTLAAAPGGALTPGAWVATRLQP